MARDISFDIIAVDKASRTLNNVGGASSKLGGALGAMGRVAAGAAVGGIVALGAAMVGGIRDAANFQTLTHKTNAVIKSTGNVANISVKGIQKLAASLEGLSGVDEELIINSQNVLATFTKIRNEAGKGNDIFNKATKAALNMSVAMGQDLQSATVMVGKALNDPIKGITAMTRAGVQFTEQQKKQIKALVESGDLLGAQKVILKELETQFGGAAKAAGGGFNGALARVKDRIGDAFRELGEKLLPALEKLADWVAAHVPDFDKLGAALKKAFGGLDVADKLRDLKGIFDGWAADFKNLWEQAKPLVDEFRKFAGPLIKDGLKDLKAAWADLSEALKDPDVRTALKALAVVLGVVLGTALLYIISTFRVAAFVLRHVIVPAFKFFAKIAALQINFALNAILIFLRGLRWVAQIAAKIPGPHQAAMRKVARAIGGAISKVERLKRAINSVPRSRTTTFRIRTVGRPPSFGGSSRTGGSSGHGSGGRAHGGPVLAGRAYTVGEKRPEVFVPDTNGKILPKAPTGGDGFGTRMDTRQLALEFVSALRRAGMYVMPIDPDRGIGRRADMLARGF